MYLLVIVWIFVYVCFLFCWWHISVCCVFIPPLCFGDLGLLENSVIPATEQDLWHVNTFRWRSTVDQRILAMGFCLFCHITFCTLHRFVCSFPHPAHVSAEWSSGISQKENSFSKMFLTGTAAKSNAAAGLQVNQGQFQGTAPKWLYSKNKQSTVVEITPLSN